ncbi:MAG: transcription elongation factor GreA [Mycoplasma sp.]
MNKILLTKESFNELQNELNLLIGTKRPEIIKQIQEAREQGDLSENADYDAAKDKQTEIEKRISEIQDILEHCEIDKGVDKKGEVSVYNFVKYIDESDKTENVVQIVGSIESDPDNHKISNESPLAKALLGRKEGETIEIKGIENHYQVTILKISPVAL